MKKILALVAFILVTGCVVLPKLIAPTYQENVEKLISNIDHAQGYSANIVSTESAWFGSINKVMIGFDPSQIDASLQGGTQKAELIIESHFGPLLFSNNLSVGLFATKVRFDGETLRKDLNWEENAPFYQLSILGGFTGNFQLTDAIPAFSNSEKTVQFSGYSGEGEMNNEAFTYEGTFDHAKASNAYRESKAEGFTLSVELLANLDTIMKGGFYDSMMNLSLDTLVLDADTELSGLSIGLGSALDTDTQLGSLEMSYLINGLVYGDFTANDLSLVTELDRLNNQFFLDFKHFSDGMLPNTNNSDVINKETLTFLKDNLNLLLGDKPEFNITNFSGTFPEGSFNANLSTHLADMNTPTIEDLSVPEFWLYNTVGSGAIEIDEALLQNLTERFIASKMRAPITTPQVKQHARLIIDGLLEQGLVTLENDKFISDIAIKEGQLTINNAPFPLM